MKTDSKIFDDAAGQEIPLDVVNEIRKFTEGTELTITETSHNLLNRPSRVSWEQLGDKLFDRMMVHEEIHDEKGEQVGTVNYDRTIDRSEITLKDSPQPPLIFTDMIYDAQMYRNNLYVLTINDLYVFSTYDDRRSKYARHKIYNYSIRNFPWRTPYPMKIKKIDIIENKKGTEASTEVIIDCDFPRSEKVYRVEEHDPISYEKIQKKASIKASIRRKKLFLLLGWTLAVEAVLFKLFNSWS